jgi:trimethylamine--corrinoid protein Co-methyltransferase
MAQVVNPGAPVMYGSVSTIADMRKGSAALGAAETGMISAASAQLGHFYGVPVRAVAGATESKQLDVQCGFERGQSLLQAALAGVNYVTCVGTVESSNMGVHDLYAIDNEIIGRVERIMRGIEVNDVSLAMEQIRNAGPHGNYLMDPFTRSNFRKEHFIPKVSDRESLEGWEKSGRQSIFEKARAAHGKNIGRTPAPRYRPGSEKGTGRLRGHGGSTHGRRLQSRRMGSLIGPRPKRRVS